MSALVFVFVMGQRLPAGGRSMSADEPLAYSYTHRRHAGAALYECSAMKSAIVDKSDQVQAGEEHSCRLYHLAMLVCPWAHVRARQPHPRRAVRGMHKWMRWTERHQPAGDAHECETDHTQ